MTTNLIALAASTRSDSVNRKLLELAVAAARSHGAQVRILDYAVCDAEIYRNDDAQPFPSGAAYLRDALNASDGIILASPEYNWSMPGSLKNLIDWLSIDPSKPFTGRTALLLCASPSIRGGILGLHQLSLPLNHLGMYVYPQLVAIGDAKSQMTAQGLTNAKDATFMAHCIKDFVRYTTALKIAA
jgi:chromate reductase